MRTGSTDESAVGTRPRHRRPIYLAVLLVLAAALLLSLGGAALAAPTYVGAVGSNYANTAGTTLSISVGAGGVAVGNTVIIAFSTRGTASYTTPTVTDSRGNTYSLAVGALCYAHGRTYIFYGPVTTALVSGDTITITTPSVASRVAVAAAFSGILTASPLDQVLGNQVLTATSTGNSGNSPTVGPTGTISQADELIIGAIGTEDASSSADAGTGTWLNAFQDGPTIKSGTGASYFWRVSLGYKIVSATGTYTAAKTYVNAPWWNAAIATFKAAPAGPTVTINQASGQTDPTASSPINFTAVFSETVTGFETGDVTLSGTAGATTATVTGSGTTYNVAVSGMTGAGTVIATIPAGVAQNGSAQTSAASTSTDNSVTYNHPPEITETDPQSVTMSEDGSPTPFSLTLNATDADAGDTLTWSISSAASHGTATASGAGTSKAIAYSPTANYHGSDSFVVQVSDGHGGIDTVTVNVTIQAVNDLPVALADSATTHRNASVNIPVLANDTDVDGDTLSVTAVSEPLYGTAVIQPDKTVTYTPDTGYTGADSFTYDISDGNGDTATATVNLMVYNIYLDGAFSSNTLASGSPITISHTTGTGADRLMLVGVSWNCGTADRTISSVTFTPSGGGAAVTLDEVKTQKSVDSSSNPRYSAIYRWPAEVDGLPSTPPSGQAGTVTILFSGSVSNGVMAGVANFAGVDQTTPLGTADGAAATSGQDATVTLTGLDGDELVFDNVFQGASGTTQTLTVGPNQTQLWNRAYVANLRAAASTEQATSAEVTMSWHAASASVWAIAAVPINPVPAVLTFTLDYAAGPNGHLAGTTHQTVNQGQDGTAVTAVPDTGYHFLKWSDNSTANPRIDTNVTANVDVTAQFEATAPLALNLTGVEGGLTTTIGTPPLSYTALTGSLGAGYLLLTNEMAANEYWLRFTSGTSTNNPLKSEMFGLTLSDSTVSAADLKAYYAARGVPADYLAYLEDAADGDVPFAYIDGATVSLCDGARWIVGGNKVPMAVPGDFPEGTYTVTGTLEDIYDGTTPVTLKLIVARASYTISASAGLGGSITPNGEQTVDYDGSRSFTVTAATGQHITGILVDGAPIALTSDVTMDYTFEHVKADHAIAATFEATAPLTLDLTGVEGGLTTTIGTPPLSYTALTGSLGAGYLLLTNYAADNEYWLRFVSGTTSSNPLTTQMVGLTLTDSTVSAADLTAYYEARGVPQAYFDYLAAAADGDVPFAYIDGATVSLCDGARWIVGGNKVPMAVPGDFPEGTYTVTGTIEDIYGNTTPVTLKLIVARANYSLDYTSGTGGQLTGTAHQTVDYGQSGSTVTAVADTGYHFTGWSDGVLIAARTDTNVTANLTVTAEFAHDTFTLDYAAGAHGNLTGSTHQTDVVYGTNGTAVTAVADTGYHFVKWSDDATANPRTDTGVTANVNVTATFAINVYTVSASAPGGQGTITPASVDVNHGSPSGDFTISPATGYHLVSLTDNGADVFGSVANGKYSITSVTEDHALVATFAIDTHAVSASAPGGHGTITPASVDVNHGSPSGDFTISPATGYHLVSLTDNGADVFGSVANGKYSITSVTEDHALVATFAINTYMITLKIGWNLVAAAPGTTFPNILWDWLGTGYTSTGSTEAWKGYWCQVDAEHSVEIQTSILPQTITLDENWNLIGNSSAYEAAIQLPSGLVAWVYHPDTGYTSVTTLQPGQGAWVKATAAGQQAILEIPAGPGA